MRRICMSALVLSALSSSAFAGPLQSIFSPYPTSDYAADSAGGQRQYYVVQPSYGAPQQPVYGAPQQADAASMSPPQPTYAPAAPQATPQAAAAPRQTYAANYARAQLPPPPPPRPGGLFDFLFGRPLQSSYAPAMPAYQPQGNYQANYRQSYAPSGQGDMVNYQVDPKYDRQVVDYPSDEPPGTIVIDTPNKFLYLVEGGGKALRYGIGVGRPGFTWSGVKTITAKREWPDWRPPADMLARRPDLPRYMPGGIDNPLGARAMYLGSTLYRIHGSNEPWTIGTNVSSGCIRMRNEDVEDLYERVQVGTKVVVI
jgi:lipoprotein-anchoring transpeptidase ErfK/SrfK